MKIQEYGILVAITTAIITGVRFLYVKFKEAQLKYRTKITGNWTNVSPVPYAVIGRLFEIPSKNL
jgi:hypothetical protein